MCGIVGSFSASYSRADHSLIERMVAMLPHRGPDERGTFVDGPAGLGHARLSIVDLSSGQQPMKSADGSLTIVFNGEIFNYIELREELLAKGHRFATRSDTEVLLQLYASEGVECVRKLNGQWSFAIWDARRQRMFLSRDRLGVRPLFYTKADGRYLFASEIKAIFADPSVPRRLDTDAIDQIFTYWFTLPPKTAFEGVYELPPGSSMTLDAGGESVWRYWEPAYDGAATSALGEEEAAEQLRALLIDATRIRLRADVPVGAYLSGGLDSTVIVALIKRFTDTPLKTFSVAFEEAEYDESAFQQEAVRHLGTEHQTVRCSNADIGRVFPQVAWHMEKPVLRTAPAPLFLLAQLVRKNGYKVVLTGEGSDEILGGYDIYKEAKIRHFWARQPESSIRPMLLKRLYPYMEGIQSQSPAFLRAFFHVQPEQLSSPLFSHLPRWELTRKLRLFYSPEFSAQIAARNGGYALSASLPAKFSSWPEFCQAQYLETAYLLPGYILSSQGDRVAMAHSVEGRYPFLDMRVVEFAAGLSPHVKMKVLDEKHILKKAAGDLIPTSVLRRPKQPYRAPDAVSFFDPATGAARESYVEELLSPEWLRRSGLFLPQAVEKLVQKVRRGGNISVKDNMALVGILSTQLIYEQYIENFSQKVAHAS